MSKAPQDAPSIINHRGRGQNFTIIANAIVEDTRLSVHARMLLCWLLGKPENWVLIHDVARKVIQVGSNKYYDVLNELITVAYVDRVYDRDPKTKRITRVRYFITDEPAYRSAPIGNTSPEPLPGNHEMAPEPLHDEPHVAQGDSLLSTERYQDRSPPLPPDEGDAERVLILEGQDDAVPAGAAVPAGTAASGSPGVPQPRRRALRRHGRQTALPIDILPPGPDYNAMVGAWSGPIHGVAAEQIWWTMPESDRQDAIDGADGFLRGHGWSNHPALARYLHERMWLSAHGGGTVRAGKRTIGDAARDLTAVTSARIADAEARETVHGADDQSATGAGRRPVTVIRGTDEWRRRVAAGHPDSLFTIVHGDRGADEGWRFEAAG